MVNVALVLVDCETGLKCFLLVLLESFLPSIMNYFRKFSRGARPI